jgi:hypothetical protein
VEDGDEDLAVNLWAEGGGGFGGEFERGGGKDLDGGRMSGWG